MTQEMTFQGSRVTSDAGLILVRELNERLGLEAIIAELSLSRSRSERCPVVRRALIRRPLVPFRAGYFARTKYWRGTGNDG
jgi:hypothetical protein